MIVMINSKKNQTKIMMMRVVKGQFKKIVNNMNKKYFKIIVAYKKTKKKKR